MENWLTLSTVQVLEEKMGVENETKASLSDALTNPKPPSTTAEGSFVVTEIDGDAPAVSTASQVVNENSSVIGDNASELGSQGGSSKISKVSGESGSKKFESYNPISGRPRENPLALGLKVDESPNTSISDPAKVINYLKPFLTFISFGLLYFKSSILKCCLFPCRLLE